MPHRNTNTPVLSDQTIEANTLHCRALQVTVINAPIFGGQWKLTVPNASIDDRLLDIVIIEEIEFGKLNHALAHYLGIQRQDDASGADEPHTFAMARHPASLTSIPGIHHFQAKGVFIVTNDGPRDATLDGEVRGQTPMYVHVAEERLRVLSPTSAESAG